MLYRWNGGEFGLLCQHFSDDPVTRLEVLQSAETLRGCGFYQQAMQYYTMLWQNKAVEAWDDLPSIIYPESMEQAEHRAYAAALEEDYLRAFAGYRMVQLYIQGNYMWNAERVTTHLNEDYPPGVHGYIYTSMATALWNNYQETQDLNQACEAAESAFEAAGDNGDDPGIAYYEEDDGMGVVIHYGFYFSNGTRKGSDPDNVFAVPEDIDSIISIPICGASVRGSVEHPPGADQHGGRRRRD